MRSVLPTPATGHKLARSMRHAMLAEVGKRPWIWYGLLLLLAAAAAFGAHKLLAYRSIAEAFSDRELLELEARIADSGPSSSIDAPPQRGGAALILHASRWKHSLQRHQIAGTALPTDERGAFELQAPAHLHDAMFALDPALRALGIQAIDTLVVHEPPAFASARTLHRIHFFDPHSGQHLGVLLHAGEDLEALLIESFGD